MLNSVAKFKSRNLPSIIDSLNNGIVPKYSFFALAALLVLYRGKDDNKEIVPLNDEANVLNYFKDLWAHGYTSLQLVKKVTKGLFESEVLYKNSKLIASYVDDILKLGTNKALEKLLK
jgi:tagaturonate reductase